MNRITTVAVFALTLLSLATESFAITPPRYRVTAITPTSTSEDNRGTDLNNNQVGVGIMSSGSATGDRALVLSNGTTQKLGILPTDPDNSFKHSYANGINNLGNIVGNSTNGTNNFDHGFFYSNGIMTDIGTLGGALSEANAVNDSNQVAGRSFITGGSVPIRWQNGQISLGSLGGPTGSAFDINASGNVVGSSDTAQGNTTAFIWKDLNGNGQSNPGEMISLGTLSNYLVSVAWGMNDLNEVVGNFAVGPADRAFYWKDTNLNNVTNSGEMVMLPILSGMVKSTAKEINNSGQIVGWNEDTNHVRYATIWDSGVPYDLNTLVDLLPGQSVPFFSNAPTINDRGEILVSGDVSTGLGAKGRVFLLTPIPEPSIILLCGLTCGLITLALKKSLKSKLNVNNNISPKSIQLFRGVLMDSNRFRLLICSILFVITSILNSQTGCAAIAIDFTGGGFGTAVPGSTLGWEFTLTQAMNVSALGMFDTTPSGLLQNHDVAIWPAAGGAPLAQLPVTSAGTVVPSTNGFGNWLFEDLPTPVSLPVGNYVIGAYYPITATPDNLFTHVGSIALAPGVLFDRIRFTSAASSTLAYPDDAAINGWIGHFGPNMILTPIPEPTSYAIFVVGITVTLAYFAFNSVSVPMPPNRFQMTCQ